MYGPRPALKKWSLEYLMQNLHATPESAKQHENSEFAVGSCARSDHLYPEMLRR